MAEFKDQAVKNALAERQRIADAVAEAQRKIAEWRSEIERIDVFVGDYERFSGLAFEQGPAATGEMPHVPAPLNNVAPSSKKRPTHNSKKEEVARVAREVIGEKGEPVQPAELFDALIARGMRIEGTDPRGVLTTMLWRMRDRIVRLTPYGYWLADKPYEKGGYDPAKQLRDLDEAEARMTDDEISGQIKSQSSAFD